MSDLAASLEQRCVDRLAAALKAALRRRSSSESRLAGALAVVTPHSDVLLGQVTTGMEQLLARGQVERPLFRAGVHAILQANGGRGDRLLRQGLTLTDDPHLLLSARTARGEVLAEPLERIATKARAQAAFCAELARVSRGESRGARLVEVATRLKEADRLQLVQSLLSFSEAAAPMPAAAWPAFRILRDAERHVGRWLAWAELGGAASRDESLAVARERMDGSGRTSRAAWQLACWALSSGREELPLRVPSLAQLERLDACRVSSPFVFRLAQHDATYARSRLLELCLGREESVRVRAHVYLSRAGDGASYDWLQQTARKRGPGYVRALCLGGMFDARGTPSSAPADLSRVKALEASVWLGLYALACRGAIAEILCGHHVRRVEHGWAT